MSRTSRPRSIVSSPRGIPVVTLVTDVANCRRAAYVGMDNRAAGETAAYLIGEWLGGARAKILAA